MKTASLLIPPLLALTLNACLCFPDDGDFGSGGGYSPGPSSCGNACAANQNCDTDLGICRTPPSKPTPRYDAGVPDSSGGGGTGGSGSADAGRDTHGGAGDAGAGTGGAGGGTGTTCETNSQCSGHTCCLSGSCQPGPVPVCQFNNQCGPQGRCRDGACEQSCITSAACGAGQSCVAGYCVTSPAGGGQCIYNLDCGAGHTCINGFCHNDCASDAACAATDRCIGGICQPDTGPRPACHSSADCAGNLMCVNAVCREACATDAQCCVNGPAGSVCRMGYCLTAHEATPACQLTTDCTAGHSCIDAVCE